MFNLPCYCILQNSFYKFACIQCYNFCLMTFFFFKFYFFDFDCTPNGIKKSILKFKYVATTMFKILREAALKIIQRRYYLPA